MTSPYTFGTKSDANAALQQALTAHGFDTKGADGIFGRNTRDAVEAAQQYFSIAPADGVPRADLLAFLGLTASAPLPKPSIFSNLSMLLSIFNLWQSLKGNPMDTSNNWFSTLVASTAGQYLIAIAATWIAQKLGLDPTTGHVTVAAVIVQVLGIVPAILGVIEAAKSKVVVNGVKVSLKSMPTTDQQAVAQIAAKNS